MLQQVLRLLDLAEDPKDGPLPLLLVGLTVVTGLVDAISYLSLGHVFVANMTGNVVFLGFSAGGAPGFSVLGSLLAVAAFLLGALSGGRLHMALALHRGRMLALTIYLQIVLVFLAMFVAIIWPVQEGSVSTWVLIVGLGLAMGLQNAAARRLNVRDLTTTVLTMTITGLAADTPLAGGTAPAHPGRRYVALLAMFSGALIGTIVARHVGVGSVLAIVLGLLMVIGAASTRLWSASESWALAAH
jgi:uncharacterized membrane protein YoaK (UPF0700 family)